MMLRPILEVQATSTEHPKDIVDIHRKCVRLDCIFRVKVIFNENNFKELWI